MGRWGLGLFEGDSDFDDLGDFCEIGDFESLEPDVLAARAYVKAVDAMSAASIESGAKDEPSAKLSDENEEDDDEWGFDVDFHNPRFPAILREHLNEGALADLIDSHMPEANHSSAKKPRWGSEQYVLVLIAFCGMQLGCNFPHGFLATLKTKLKIFVRAGALLDEGETQMRRGCDEYVDGKPYEFVSLDLLETVDLLPKSGEGGGRKRPEMKAAGLEAVPDLTLFEPQPSDPNHSMYRFAEWHLRFPKNLCANCGSATGYGDHDALQRCVGCKDTLYCFEGCQKWHFFCHRDHCEEAQGVNAKAQGESDGSAEPGAQVPDETDGHGDIMGAPEKKKQKLSSAQ